MGRQGRDAHRCPRPDPRPGCLRGTFPADLTIKRVDEQLCGLRLVRSDPPKVFQRLRERRVLVEHTRPVVALPPTLVRLDRTKEPGHPASVSTRDETSQCRRSPAPPLTEIGEAADVGDF
jgi:hypothetical protein